MTKQWLVQCAYLIHCIISTNTLSQSIRCFYYKSPQISMSHPQSLQISPFVYSHWLGALYCYLVYYCTVNFFPLWSCNSATLPWQSKYLINRNGPCILDLKVPCKVVFIITLWPAENKPTIVHCWSRWSLYSYNLWEVFILPLHEYTKFSSLKPKHRLGFLLVINPSHQHSMVYWMVHK